MKDWIQNRLKKKKKEKARLWDVVSSLDQCLTVSSQLESE